jgi:hypothetical protein
MSTAPLSEWLELMLAEVARKRAHLEQEAREREAGTAPTPRGDEPTT